MTKIRVDDFPAGPRLDAEVARILGWTKLRKMERCDDWKGKPPGGSWYVIPRYSVDIGAAWRLVERLIGSNFSFEIEFCKVLTDSLSFENGWIVTCSNTGESSRDSDIYCSTDGETTPLAITRAFLKVNGIEHIEHEGETNDQTLTSEQTSETEQGTESDPTTTI